MSYKNKETALNNLLTEQNRVVSLYNVLNMISAAPYRGGEVCVP